MKYETSIFKAPWVLVVSIIFMFWRHDFLQARSSAKRRHYQRRHTDILVLVDDDDAGQRVAQQALRAARGKRRDLDETDEDWNPGDG